MVTRTVGADAARNTTAPSRLGWALALLLTALSARAAEPPRKPAAPAPAPQHFALRILAQDWFSLGLGYDGLKAWQILQHGPLTDLARLEEADVESYDASCETLTLSPAAVQRLRETLSTPPRLKRGDPQRTPVTGLSLETELYLKVFLVELDGRPLYGGVFLDAVSQMPIEFPVIRIDETNPPHVVLHIAPVQAWSLYADPQAAVDPVVEEIRSALGSPWEDKLKDPKYKALVDGFWAKINDSRVEQIFTRTGALQRSGHCTR